MAAPRWTPAQARAEAQRHELAVSRTLASAYDWRYEPAYPLGPIGWYSEETGVHHDTVGEWVQWLREEDARQRAGRRRLRYLGRGSIEARWLADPEDHPLTLVEEAQGTYLWDGHHRVGVAHLHGLHFVPAFVGTPKQKAARRRNPTWRHEPFRIEAEEHPDGLWGYAVLDEQDAVVFDTEEGLFDSEEEAVRAAMRELDRFERWREPDYDDGHTQLWWGPSDALADADSITEVSEGCVSRYDFVGGYEGFEDDQWRKITVCPEAVPSSDPRIVVGVGVDQIAERGGDEEILSDDDVKAQWPDAERKPNPHRIKARLLDWNPSPPAPQPTTILPVIKRGMVPRLIIGQYGRVAVYTYRGWELEVKPSPTRGLPWEVTAVSTRQPPALEHALATTFDGAVCTGKILVDLVFTRGRMTTTAETALIRVWQHVYLLAVNLASAGYLPTRDIVASQLEGEFRQIRRGGAYGIGMGTVKWFDNLPLHQRVALIDDRLELAICMYGTNPKDWP